MQKKHALGHVNWGKNEICWSKPFFNDLLKQKMSMAAALFEALGTLLHEIIHLLYPEFGEQRVREKTCEWLKRNLWLDGYEKVTRLSKAELIALGYKEQQK